VMAVSRPVTASKLCVVTTPLPGALLNDVY
jgi:hypothetical protein